VVPLAMEAVAFEPVLVVTVIFDTQVQAFGRLAGDAISAVLAFVFDLFVSAERLALFAGFDSRHEINHSLVLSPPGTIYCLQLLSQPAAAKTDGVGRGKDDFSLARSTWFY